MAFMNLAVLALAAAASGTLQPATVKSSIAAHEPTITSEIFVEKAVLSGLFEVEAAKLAVAKSSNPDVNAFATRMIGDHNSSSIELAYVVSKLPIHVSIPSRLDRENSRHLKKLRELSGDKFDVAYGLMMRDGHDQALNIFNLASTETLVQEDLRAFATRTLPTLRAHHELASTLPAPPPKK